MKYKNLSPPLFIEEVAQAKRSDGGVKTPAVGADRRVCPTKQQQGNNKGERFELLSLRQLLFPKEEH